MQRPSFAILRDVSELVAMDEGLEVDDEDPRVGGVAAGRSGSEPTSPEVDDEGELAGADVEYSDDQVRGLLSAARCRLQQRTACASLQGAERWTLPGSSIAA